MKSSVVLTPKRCEQGISPHVMCQETRSQPFPRTKTLAGAFPSPLLFWEEQHQFLEAAVWHLPYALDALQRCTYGNSALCLALHSSVPPGDQPKGCTKYRQDKYMLVFLRKLVTGLSCSERRVTVYHSWLAEQTLFCPFDGTTISVVLECDFTILIQCRVLPLETRKDS